MRVLMILLAFVVCACGGQRGLEQSTGGAAPPAGCEAAAERQHGNSCAPKTNGKRGSNGNEAAEGDASEAPPSKPIGDGFQSGSRRKTIDSRYARHLKALLIEQGFRFEARWLNEVLKRDKGLDYQGFFIDADAGWPQPVSIYDDAVKQRVKPVRAPFWNDETRVTDESAFLALGYDVIIVGDVDPESKEWREEYWKWLETWTRSGGGLIFSAGMCFNPGGYTNEYAQKLLPLTPDNAGAKVDTTKVKYWGLTDEGSTHSILKLSDDKQRIHELLGAEVDGKFARGQLDGVFWHVANCRPKDGATVLARAVLEGGKVGESPPMLVATEYGKGRVLFVGTDDTHRWRALVGEIYFYRFWQNAMAWAAKAED